MCRSTGAESHVLTDIVDIMTSILPEEAHEEIPVGFAVVGHIGMEARS
jgi:hypothetical protein